MTKEQIASLLRAYDEAVEAGDEDFIEELLRDYPSLLNYDENGNYVGPVRHENGFTA